MHSVRIDLQSSKHPNSDSSCEWHLRCNHPSPRYCVRRRRNRPWMLVFVLSQCRISQRKSRTCTCPSSFVYNSSGDGIERRRHKCLLWNLVLEKSLTWESVPAVVDGRYNDHRVPDRIADSSRHLLTQRYSLHDLPSLQDCFRSTRLYLYQNPSQNLLSHSSCLRNGDESHQELYYRSHLW